MNILIIVVPWICCMVFIIYLLIKIYDKRCPYHNKCNLFNTKNIECISNNPFRVYCKRQKSYDEGIIK